jgi:hypothetical protein
MVGDENAGFSRPTAARKHRMDRMVTPIMKTSLDTLTISLTVTTALLAANEALTIDGKLEDAFWKSVAPQRLVLSQDGVTSATGGELRIAIRGRYLCVGARLPEPGGRITAPGRH